MQRGGHDDLPVPVRGGGGNEHNHDDLSVVLAGGGGWSIRAGRHVTARPDTPNHQR